MFNSVHVPHLKGSINTVIENKGMRHKATLMVWQGDERNWAGICSERLMRERDADEGVGREGLGIAEQMRGVGTGVNVGWAVRWWGEEGKSEGVWRVDGERQWRDLGNSKCGYTDWLTPSANLLCVKGSWGYGPKCKVFYKWPHVDTTSLVPWPTAKFSNKFIWDLLAGFFGLSC